MSKTYRDIGVLATVALLSPMICWPATPGRHPHYMQARSDLRTALLLLRVHDEPDVMRHVHVADREIEVAIREIDHATVLDRKDIVYNPRIDANLDRPGRFRKVMSLLASARRDIAREEDNPRALAWRDGAFQRIDKSMEELRKAARDLRIDRLEGR